jgi:transposase-like protein
LTDGESDKIVYDQVHQNSTYANPAQIRSNLQNWLNSGKSAEVVGEELGINANLLYAWRKLSPAGAGGRAPATKPGSLADLQGQLDAAHRELRHVREQVTILKKHWAFSPNRPPTL